MIQEKIKNGDIVLTQSAIGTEYLEPHERDSKAKDGPGRAYYRSTVRRLFPVYCPAERCLDAFASGVVRLSCINAVIFCMYVPPVYYVQCVSE